MNCARCGAELEIGVWDGLPAIMPCEGCIRDVRSESCEECSRADCSQCDRGDCGECERGDCTNCQQYALGVEEGIQSRDAEVVALQQDVERSYQNGYDAGYDAALNT